MNGRLVKEADNVVKIGNDAHIPEIRNRRGTITLTFGGAEVVESVQIEGSITLSEICYMQKVLEAWIFEKLGEP
jgi:hypothetical protein